MPHMEGQHEIQALRFWDGDPAVRLLEADEDGLYMLLVGALGTLFQSSGNLVIALLATGLAAFLVQPLYQEGA